jgi:hypothetical protein
MPAVQKWQMTSFTEERHARKVARERTEREAKDEAKRDDGYRCRWPHACHTKTLDGAHLDAKGLGGSPDGARNTPQNIITLCREAHRGVRSLHSGHKRIVPLTPDGTRGPVEFWDTDTDGREYLVGREIEPRIFERD